MIRWRAGNRKKPERERLEKENFQKNRSETDIEVEGVRRNSTWQSGPQADEERGR